MKKHFCILFIFSVYIQNIFCRDSTFILSTNSIENYTPAFIGNGYFSLTTTLLGIDGSESYMEGLYDKAENDVARIAALPCWNCINISAVNNNKSFSINSIKNIENYFQRLNLFNGTLTTSYVYKNSDRNIDINNQIFISRSNKNIACIKLKLKTNFNGKLRISFPLVERTKPDRMSYAVLKKIEPNLPDAWPKEWYPGFIKVISTEASADSAFISLIGKPSGKNKLIVEASKINWNGNLRNLKFSANADSNKSDFIIEFYAENNEEYTFYKCLYISKINSLADTIGSFKNFNSILKKGYDKLLEENNSSWKNIWSTDIIIEGDPNLQRVIHSMIFYLLCSIREGTNFSLPPMGLSTAGYYGHIFWDADTFMFPSLLLMHPELAKSMVNFRFESLEAAKANAKLNGYNGAMYPWESDELGHEATPQFAYQNALHENHITGDIALAQWQYYLATYDKNWLADTGYQVIKATADFWISRVSFNKEKNRYEIKNIVSVDEGRIGINNDTYTNSIAKKNLEIAIEASRILDEKVNPKWIEIKNKLYIPYDSLNQIYPTYENSPDSILGSVVTLLSYPINIKMSEKTKSNNLENAVELISKEGLGAMMTITLLPIIAAELENEKLFNILSDKSYQSYLHPPFNVTSETPRNKSINFITGAGGFLQQIIFGCTGLRITKEGVIQKYKPMLPKNIKKLILRNFHLRNERFDIIVENDHLDFMKKNNFHFKRK